MFISKIKWVLILTILLGCVSRCRVDDELYRLKKTEWSPEVAIPLARAQVSIADILAKNRPEVISIDDENRISLTYDAVLYSKSGADLLKLIDRTINILPGLNQYELLLNQYSVIQYLELAKGELQLLLQKNGRSEIGRIEINIPSLIIDGQPFKMVREDVGGLDEAIDLTGAELLFDEGDDSQVSVELEILDENGLDITSDYSLYLTFKKLVIKRAKGWFDNLILDFKTDTITLDVFENWKSGSVFLDDPKMFIGISNSIGIPFNGSVSTFDVSTDGKGSTIVPIDFFNALGDSFSVAYPTSDQLEGYINSIYKLDGTNSNLSNVIEISPSELHYGFNFVAKHDYTLDEPGFISDTSRLTVSTALELPFTGRIQDVYVVDTIGISNAFIDDLSDIESATLEITTTNALPLGVDLQLYLLGDNQILDSVFSNPQFLVSATVDENGYVISSGEMNNSIATSAAQLNALKKADSIAVYGRLHTSQAGQKTVSFQSTNYLGMNLALRLKYKVL